MDTWTNTPAIGLINYIVSSPNNDPQTTHLGLAITANAPTTFDVEVNAKKIVTFSIPGGARCIKLMRHGLDIFGKPNLFSIKLIAKNNAQLQLTQVGLFTKPPQELLLQLLSKHPTFAIDYYLETHIPYVGTTPILAMGEYKVQDLWDGMVGGWHPMEPDGIFTNGYQASIYFKPSIKPPRSFAISLSFYVYRWLIEINTDISIKIGNCPFVPLLESAMRKSDIGIVKREFTLPIDAALDTEGRLAITLQSKGAIAPIDVGENMDSRALAIKLLRLSIQSG